MKSRILKTVGIVLAAVACFGMSVTAAPSPTASTPVSNTASAVDADGASVEIKITSEIPEEYQEAVADIKSATGFSETVESLKLTEVLGGVPAENITLLDVKEVSVLGEAKFPVTITFSVEGVTEDTKGTILHYDSEASAWEVIDTTMGKETMTGTFESLSPVAFVVDKTTLESASASSTSPKTSAQTPAVFGAAAILAAAAAFGLKKKRFF